NNMDLDKLNSYYFETGPIRPPSEAYSLLIRATRNCPWNRCSFCQTYKGRKFEPRPTEDVIKDIETARAIVEGIKELGLKNGFGNQPREVAAYIHGLVTNNDSVRQVSLWQWAGGRSAFLQDANSIVMRHADLLEVVSALKDNFPELDRITSYGRSKTAAKKSVQEFIELRQAGLSRIHIGMESGSDAVLKFVDKGMTADDHVKGGLNIKEAGIELSEYYMPGLGGRQWSKEHAEQSANVLNQVDPDFIRLRTLMMGETLALWVSVQSGEYDMLAEDEIVREIGEFISKLDFTGELKSDHILNLLPELEGKFPEAKQACIDTVERYLEMPLKERLNYRLGRRAGLYEKLNDIYDAAKYEKIDAAMRRVGADTAGKVDELIDGMKKRFI
ncbi:MAG: radical SAM protein, partial [Chloroflexi bacterium]|nr:radical SAM protein [Chloroflexota bacterium]